MSALYLNPNQKAALDAGFAEFIFEPRFDLISRVDAAMPTNVGEIAVSWVCEAETCTLTLTRPAGAEPYFAAPAGWQIIDRRDDGSTLTLSLKK